MPQFTYGFTRFGTPNHFLAPRGRVIYWSDSLGTGTPPPGIRRGHGRLLPGVIDNPAIQGPFTYVAHFAAVWHQDIGLHIGLTTRGQGPTPPGSKQGMDGYNPGVFAQSLLGLTHTRTKEGQL